MSTPLTNAERQKRYRNKTKALAKMALHQSTSGLVAHLLVAARDRMAELDIPYRSQALGPQFREALIDALKIYPDEHLFLEACKTYELLQGRFIRSHARRSEAYEERDARQGELGRAYEAASLRVGKRRPD